MSELWIPNKYRPKQVEKHTFVYFEDRFGHIIIPPIADAHTPRGFERHEVSGAKEIEAVSRRFAEQKARMFAQMDERTIERAEKRMAEIRNNLHVQMARTSSQYEKDFIRDALKKIEEDEHKLKERKREFHLHMEGYEAPTS